MISSGVLLIMITLIYLQSSWGIPWFPRLPFLGQKPTNQTPLNEDKESILRLQAKIAILSSEIDILKHKLRKSHAETQRYRRTRIEMHERIEELHVSHKEELRKIENAHKHAIEALKTAILEELRAQFEKDKEALKAQLKERSKEEIEEFKRQIANLKSSEEDSKKKIDTFKKEIKEIRSAAEKAAVESKLKGEKYLKEINNLKSKTPGSSSPASRQSQSNDRENNKNAPSSSSKKNPPPKNVINRSRGGKSK